VLTYEMWMSVQLLSISGIDSKLGLTMVRPSLKSSSLDLQPISKHVCQMTFFRFLTSGDLDLWPFQLKIGTHERSSGHYSYPGERLY